MEDRKLDVRRSAPDGRTAMNRIKFDAHINECTDCQPGLCLEAQTLWRNTCLAALRAHTAKGGA